MKLPFTIKHSVAIPVGILGLTALIFLLLINGRSQVNGNTIQEKAWNVSVINAEPGTYTPNLILHGMTESPQRAVIEATINADVVNTLKYEGEKVNKGDLLIQLDDREAKLIFNQRQAEVNDLNAQIKAEHNRANADKKALAYEKTLVEIGRRAVQRQAALIKSQVGSESAVDEAKKILQQQELNLTARELAVEDHANRLSQLKAKLAKAEALFDQAKLDLSRTQIRAPFAGRITKLRVSVGNRVQAGEALIELYNIERVEVRAQIPAHFVERAYLAIKRGLKLTATAILDNKKIDLAFDRLAGAVGSGSGGVDALFKVIKANGNLALGRTLEIYLNLPKQENVYPIPSQALYGTDRIYIVKDKRMQGLSVTRVGLIQQPDEQPKVLIRSQQLKAGDKIITTQLPNARTGLRVDIVEQ